MLALDQLPLNKKRILSPCEWNPESIKKNLCMQVYLTQRKVTSPSTFQVERSAQVIV